MSDAQSGGEQALQQVGRQLQDLKTAIHVVEYEASAHRAHMRALSGSRRWRIMAPFRKVRAALHRLLVLVSPEAGHPGFDRPSPRDRHAAAVSIGLPALQQTALAEKSLAARAMIAYMATEGAEDISVPVAEPGATPDFSRCVVRCTRADATLALARVVAGQQIEACDAAFSVALYRHHQHVFSMAGWEVADHVLFIDLLDSLGEREAALQHLHQSKLANTSLQDHRCLTANLHHPAAGEDDGPWLAAINNMFLAAGLEPFALADTAGFAIDRMICSTPAAMREQQPLVSVLMPVYKPDAAVDTAIDSVLQQSWRNLELIIIDDDSPREDFARLSAWPGRDPRVRLLRAERNGGTYRVRNLGLAQARGEFVTCHDADDWSHPRKIEIQARHLLDHGQHAANLSSWARVSPALRFQRFSMRGSLVYPNLSSLMFRRQAVLSRLGNWDEVRYGADNEFYKRIELVFGRKLDIVGAAPLSFGRIHDRSLTSGTLGRGYVSFERRMYESAWTCWHQAIVAGASSPHLDPSLARSFPAPAAMLPGHRNDGVVAAFDIIAVADYCLEGPAAEFFAGRIEQWLSQGLGVALCQVRSLHTAAVASRHIDGRIQRLVNASGLEMLPLDAKVDCRRVHVLYPRILEFTSQLRAGLRAAKLTFEWPQTTPALAGVGQPMDMEACLREAERLFGVSPEERTA